MSAGWTTPADVAARVRRRWDDGSLLRWYASGVGFEPLRVGVRGPRASEVGDNLEAVRAWVADLDAGRRGGARYELEWAAIGGRSIGRNSVPSHAVVSTFEQAWNLLGVGAQVRMFNELLAVAAAHAALGTWVAGNPLRAITLHADMPRLVAACTWLEASRDSGRYLREISAPGVDTKFVEQHRSVLAEVLGVPSTVSGFVTALGLRSKPQLVRIRADSLLGLSALTELVFRVDELAALAMVPSRVLVVENEVTYLSVPVPAGGMVLWGRGFEVDRVGRLPWLSGVPVDYWGDIDTHGFAILDRLRAWLPQVRSVLMDRQTLMAHRDRWVTEERPAASTLNRLDAVEQALYVDLVEGRLGDRVRLEQERIDWQWAVERLASPDSGD